MSARDAILGRVRSALAAPADDAQRLAAVEARLAKPPKGVIPARGQLEPDARAALFAAMADKVHATTERVTSRDDVPKAVARYLRERNLRASVRMGEDPRLTKMPWDGQRHLEIRTGRSDGEDESGVSYATAGVAETGTLVMTSGAANPTTINFLPDYHIVVVDAADIDGDMESTLRRIRRKHGRGTMPRTVNFITGPSKSGDIEQKILLGAHGPRALHIVVVDG